MKRIPTMASLPFSTVSMRGAIGAVALAAGILGAALLGGGSASAAAKPTLPDFLGYSVVTELASADHADRIAWVEVVKGVRNVWAAAFREASAAPPKDTQADEAALARKAASR